MRKKLGVALVVALSFSMLATTGCGSKKSSDKNEETTTTKAEETEKETQSEPETEPEKVDYTAGYNLVWSDEFDNGVNKDDWNYELHEPGWVNNELQEYVESEENVYTKDGILVIKPVKKVAADGTVSYTSGRLNTQGKHDFTYGIFEASIKMPKGQGFLPAFWLMASDENIYGQWPRCGEIDIAEVLGNETNKTYGTIHYGNPHKESQGTYTLSSGDFAEEFHTYAVEWLPGKINWYVDGILLHTESDWYSKTEGVGEITYPAPFDQPFYMILNLAVGGNWPGNPNDSTDFDTANMQIDYVKVYQLEKYDENVKKDEVEISYKEADSTGNYVTNGDFADAEDLSDSTDWTFLLNANGEGGAEISDNTMVVKTDKAGDEEYSIQLVQPNMPIYKTGKYKLTFDAWADADRTMKVAVTAPNVDWIRYLNDTALDLKTDKQSYTFEFEVTAENDPTGRLEFNMGKTASTDTIYIQNVRLEMTEGPEGGAVSSGKTVLADGNYVYNACFQEGDAHLGSWEISKNDSATVEVTPFADKRRLQVVAGTNAEDVVVKQSDLAVMSGTEYKFTFDAEVTEATTIKVVVCGNEQTFELDGNKSYDLTFMPGDNTDLIFYLGNAKDIKLDNVRIVEDVMIKNGSFNAGLTGYEVYVDSSADSTYVVDSLNEDNAADFTINNTGDADWKIQLKQNNVELVKGHNYRFTFMAKSSMNRSIRALMQGGENKGWFVYSGENTVELTNEFQTFTLDFEMTEETDPEAFLSICLGAVDGQVITEQHQVVIDNITLEEI